MKKLDAGNVLDLTEGLIDRISEEVGHSFTESEEASLAVAVWQWLCRYSPNSVTDSTEDCATSQGDDD